MKKWVFRILQGLLAAGFLMASMSKFFMGTDEVRRLYTEPLGYAPGFMYFIAAVELLATVCLIVGFRNVILTVLGAGALIVVMAGAFVSVLVSEMGFGEALSPLVGLIVALVIFFGKLRPAAARLKKPQAA
ncbi:DoxX family protein [Paenibacillus cymbidii]|uniref:DoxX family protein n=1 Tax=Paenibacillus cymbidii TaxID=1639034 RepID=UPI0010805340|nr:DoxX family protein [Paenibacillus cymbidii]